MLKLKSHWLICTSLALAVVLCFSNSIQNGFVLGDNQFIIDNHKVRDIGNVFYGFKSNLWDAADADQSSFYRPLLMASTIIEFHFFGKNPMGYHLVNIVLMLLIVVLIFIITNICVQNTLISIATSLIYAVHPLHCHSVTYIQGLGDLQASFFILLSLYFYMVFFSKERAGLACAVGAAFYGIAIFTKEIALALPVIAFCYNAFKAGDLKEVFKRRSLVAYASLAAVTVVYFVCRYQALGFVTSLQTETIDPPFYTHLLIVLASFGLYISNFFNPTGLTYIVPFLAPKSFFDLYVIVGFLFFVLGGVLAALIVRSKISIWLMWAWLLYFVPLLPVSNIIPISYYARDHFSFFPTIGLCLLVAFALHYLYSRPLKFFKGLSVAMLAFFVIAFSYLTYVRNNVWSSEIALLGESLKKIPEEIFNDKTLAPWDRRTALQYALAFNSLGYFSLEKGDYKKAVPYFESGLRLMPRYSDLMNNLSLAYKELDKIEQAKGLLFKILETDKGYYRAYTNLANIYVDEKNYALAKEYFEKSLTIQKDNYFALNGLGTTYFHLGELSKSIQYFKQATSVFPMRPLAWQNLVITYQRIGEPTKASNALQIFQELVGKQSGSE